jgi:predicted lipoprotein with Yx(FWY)xxD motif
MPRILTVLTIFVASAAVATALALAADTPETGTASNRLAQVASAPAAPERAARAAAARRATVTVRDSRYGPVVFDGAGRALYVFTRERSSRPRCYGDCADAWPPLLTRGEPRAARGARAPLLGTTRRRGGNRQVTYRGRPLYYFVGDTRPGLITCHDVREFGGTWLVVHADGRPAD